MTSEAQARFIVDSLLGDEEWETPSGTKAYTYFQGMRTESAWAEWKQLFYGTPLDKRPRRLISRMGEDRA